MAQKLTVAILGFGLSGRYLQAPFFLANPNFRLKSILSKNQNPQEVYPSVQVVRDLDSVLNDPEIELVCISTPNETHFDYAKKALLAGKHILVEKPMTATVAEANELIELAKSKSLILSIFQNRRFDSDFLTVKSIIESGILGKLLSYEAHFDRYKPTLNVKKWKEVQGPSNGILYDLGSHLIDQAIALFGSPNKVWGETFTQRENSEIDDAFDIRLDYQNLKVTLKASLLVREDLPRYILHGTNGSFIKYGIDIQEDQLKAGLTPNSADFGVEPNKNWGILNTDFNSLHFKGNIETLKGNWAMLFQNLYEAIRNNAELLIKPEEVIEQIKIMEAIKKLD